jgi:hypothetical protein
MDSVKTAEFNFICPRCESVMNIQANLEQHSELKPDFLPFPIDNNAIQCLNCGLQSNITPLRLQIEALTRKKVVK